MKINPHPPTSWQDLQTQVGRILEECGMSAKVEETVRTARGTVNIDVLARETGQVPNSTYFCECKHWSTPVTKAIVHGFRTVVSDYGANRGYIIASGGFQSGAIEAAEFSNVELLTWEQFENLWMTRWTDTYLRPRLYEAHELICKYVEPCIGTAMVRRADGLPPDRQAEFRRMRLDPANVLPENLALHFGASWNVALQLSKFRLPYAEWVEPSALAYMPPELAATDSLRAFGDHLCDWIDRVRADFDALFDVDAG